MAGALVWVTGVSGGIGGAMAATVPWEGARLIGVGRHQREGIDHVTADLADPAGWRRVQRSFQEEVSGFTGDHVALVHAAGTIEPVGFAGEVDMHAYERNVLLNSASPQVLGHLFLEAVREIRADRHLIMLTSGAARSIYPGWTSYGAGKAATDQWVRDAGAEQSIRGGVRILSVAPGTVDTDMQAGLRSTSEDDFPQREKFLEAHRAGKLTDPAEVAGRIWSLLDRGLDSGSVVDLRELS